MAVDTPFRTNPSLGPNLTQVITAESGSWYDDIGSPQLGDISEGTDGRRYMWVEASGTIAAAAAPGTQVAVTVTGYDNITVATGSGGWYAPPSTVYPDSLVAGDRFWVAKGTAP
jgi:hypothetical protein